MSEVIDIPLEKRVKEAVTGNKKALSDVIRTIEKQVYALSIRFLLHPHDAEDATQEILMRIINNLSSFEGNSRFSTWVYRVACNTLISIQKKRDNKPMISFDIFAEDLAHGNEENDDGHKSNPDYQRILQEIRIGCTTAMLQCLDDDSRMSYILGEILEFDHSEAANALNVPSATYRKRLSRARKNVNEFMSDNCGLANPKNACRCNKRVSKAINAKCIDPDNLIFASSDNSAKSFPEVLDYIRSIDTAHRAAAIYRANPTDKRSEQFFSWLQSQLTEKESIEKTA